VRVLKIILVAAALVASGVQYFQETRRLATIRRLPGPEARDFYEATRERGERLMLVVTALLVAAGAAALVKTFVITP
jgi:hypothetical protein